VKFWLSAILTVFIWAASPQLHAQDTDAMLKKGNRLYEAQAYYDAIELYREVLMFDNAQEAKMNLAHCYRLVGNFTEAEYWYRLIMPNSSNRDIEFYLAQSLQGQGKYDEAKNWYVKYQDLYPRAKIFADACDNHQQWYANQSKVQIKGLPINSPNAEFAPMFFKDNQLVFTSSRSGNYKPQNDYYERKEDFLDLFITSPLGLNSFKPPKRLGGNINSNLHDGPACFDMQYKKVWFTRNSPTKGKGVQQRTNQLHLQLYSADVNEKGKWINVLPFDYNDKTYSVAHPSLSEDGNLLYFSSNMPGGFGGADLYVCVRQDTTWGEPQNLGPDINSPDDEMFPTITPNGRLYFASNGHPGLGGFDLFFTEPIKGKWSIPINLGLPFNSAKDDITLIEDANGKGGFFASNRDGGEGSDDIYRYDLMQTLKYPKLKPGNKRVAKPVYNFSFEPTDPLTFNQIGKQKKGKNKKKKETQVEQTQPQPTEKPKKSLLDKFKKKEAKPVNEKDKTIAEKPTQKPPKKTKPPNQKTEKTTKNKPTKKTKKKKENAIVKAEKAPIPYLKRSLNVLLDLGNVAFLPKDVNVSEQTYNQIVPLIDYMKKHPSINIVIENYTDSRGDYIDNMNLTEMQLNNLAKYFIANDVSKRRIKLIPRGENTILNECIDNMPCTESQHVINNRMIIWEAEAYKNRFKTEQELLEIKQQKAPEKVNEQTTQPLEKVVSTQVPTLKPPIVQQTDRIDGFTYDILLGPYPEIEPKLKKLISDFDLKASYFKRGKKGKIVRLGRLGTVAEAEAVLQYFQQNGYRKTKVEVYMNGKLSEFKLSDIKKRGIK